MAPAVEDIMEQTTALVVPALDLAVTRLSPVIQDPVRHHLAGGGKRLRASLVLCSAEAVGAPASIGVPGAVAIELVHNYSLVHDDIIDGDEERRHRRTVWAEYGVGSAIITGDALAALSIQVLLDEPSPARVAAAVALAEATQEMIAGQADDMAFELRPQISLDECLAMEMGKTGALLGCAASLGAILAGASQPTIDALARFGRELGIAFQAIDDVLGIWGQPGATGKAVGNDLMAHKKTVPVSMAYAEAAAPSSAVGAEELHAALEGHLDPAGVARAIALLDQLGVQEQAMSLADDHLQRALGALEQAELRADGRDQLRAIAHFVTERDR